MPEEDEAPARPAAASPGKKKAEMLEREVSRRRLLEYQGSMATQTCLGAPMAPTYSEQRCDPNGNAPLFSFAVITDIQYADIDDGFSFLGIPRYYRHSLDVVRRAVASWNATHNVSFAVHFGDLVDGYCPKDRSHEAFSLLLKELGQFRGGPVYHMLGNHCLYNLRRPELNKILSISPTPEGASYYHFSPYPKFRIVVLDAYDVSELGWPEDHPKAIEARALLAQHNPNADKNSPHGLTGPARRFVKYNGGVGPEQMAWLKQTLQDSDAKAEVVLVACHMPLDPSGLPTPTCLLWNYEEVREVLQSSTSVVAVFCGHAHFGAYAVDTCGIHYRVLEAAVPHWCWKNAEHRNAL